MQATALQHQQYQALVSLGINRKTATRMIARQAARLLKSEAIDRPLPTVDTTEADKRREELEREQRQDQAPDQQAAEKKPVKLVRDANRLVLKRKPAKKGDDRPTSPTMRIVERLDGTQWLYQVAPNGKLTVRQLGKYRTPVVVETLVDDKKTEDKEMKKSKKLESLIVTARSNPEKLTANTRQAVNNYLTRNGQAPITTPVPAVPWFRQQTLAEIAATREAKRPAPGATAAVTGVFDAAIRQQCVPQQLSGHAQAAVKVGLSPDTPGIEGMTLQQMQQQAQQQQQEAARAMRAKQGLNY